MRTTLNLTKPNIAKQNIVLKQKNNFVISYELKQVN